MFIEPEKQQKFQNQKFFNKTHDAKKFLQDSESAGETVPAIQQKNIAFPKYNPEGKRSFFQKGYRPKFNFHPTLNQNLRREQKIPEISPCLLELDRYNVSNSVKKNGCLSSNYYHSNEYPATYSRKQSGAGDDPKISTKKKCGINSCQAQSRVQDFGLGNSVDGLSTNLKNLMFASQDSLSYGIFNQSQDQVLLTLENDLSPKFDDITVSSSSKTRTKKPEQLGQSFNNSSFMSRASKAQTKQKINSPQFGYLDAIQGGYIAQVKGPDIQPWLTANPPKKV